MDTSKINELKTRASGVKNETTQGGNTADRVGQLMYDMIDYDANQSNAINILEGKANSIQEQINEIIEGGGGGGGTAGQQETFFLNIAHNTVPDLPSVSEYNSSTQTFVHGTQVWSKTNTNPGDNEDTYMIWSWFVAGVPQSVSGPVRIYNSASSGSNGEDANETEWVYRLAQTKPTAEILAQWTTDLANAKGTSGTGGKNYTNPDVQPPDWTDNPQGIDSLNKYEYASFRVSALDANGKRKWGDTGFSEPILWSNWGEKGTDGDGVEYIFYADKNGTIEPGNDPKEWTNDEHFQDPEYIRDDTKWKDDPIDLSEEGFGPGSVEWVSMRKKQTVIKNGVEVHEWQAYSEPAVWSRLGKDGVVDGYTIDLVNENMIVNTDEDGKVTGYTNRGWVQVYHNSAPIPYADQASSTEYTYTIGTPIDASGNTVSGVSASKNSTDKTQVDVNIPTFDNFKSKSVFIPITVTLPNSTNRSLEFTLYGVVGGEFIDMYVGTKAIRCKTDGTDPQPDTVEIGVTLGKTTYKSVYNGGPGSAEELGYTFEYGYDNGVAWPHGGPISVVGEHSTLDVYMYKDGHFVDSESVPYIKDGKNGDPGRGIESIVTHYRAVAVKEAPTDIGINDPIDPAELTNPAWGQAAPYLYARDYTTYTNGDVAWGTPYFVNEWHEGGSGEATTMYDLVVDPAVAKFYVDKSTNTLSPEYINVSCIGKWIKGSEAGDFVTIDDVYTDPERKYKIYQDVTCNDGKHYDNVGPNKQENKKNQYDYGDEVTVSNTGSSDLDVVAVNFYLATGMSGSSLTGVYKQVSVPVDRDGLKGQDGGGSTGQVGKFYYYGGDFDYNPTLTVDTYQAPYVLRGNNYYMYIGEDITIDTSKKPGESSGDGYWKIIKYEPFLMSDALFSKYGHVGALIINRDWAISQYGAINGTPADPTKAYTSFDPIAFMFSLNKSVSIGVITRSSSNTNLPSSQVFKVKSEATILVEGSMSGSASIKLIKFKDPDYFRLDNSGTLNLYDIASEQTLSFNEDGEASAVLYNGVYCLVGGSVSSITVTAYTGSSVFKPHYALDLRSGFTYQNDAYLKGTLVAENANNSITIDPDSNGTASIVGKSGGTEVFNLGFQTVGNETRGYYKTLSNNGENNVVISSYQNKDANTYFTGMSVKQKDGGTVVFGSKDGKAYISASNAKWPTLSDSVYHGDIFVNEWGVLSPHAWGEDNTDMIQTITSVGASNINETTGIVIDSAVGDTSLTLPSKGLYRGRIIWIKKTASGHCDVYGASGTFILQFSSSSGAQFFVYNGTGWK